MCCISLVAYIKQARQVRDVPRFARVVVIHKLVLNPQN